MKELLFYKSTDSSDVILIATDILQKDPGVQALAHASTTLTQIKKAYVEYDYDQAIRLIKELALHAEDKGLIEYIEIALQQAKQRDIPQELESRRLFETILALESWSTLATPAMYESVNRLAHFVVGTHRLYAESVDIDLDRPDKVTDMKSLERVIACLRIFGAPEDEGGVKVINDKSAIIRGMGNTVSDLKDRGKPRSKSDAGQSKHMGLIKSTKPAPLDLRRSTPRTQLSDLYTEFDPKVSHGYSASNKTVPYVNSVSGTAYVTVAIMDQYAIEHADSPTLQNDVNNIFKAAVYLMVKEGYHSMGEIIDVFRSREVAEVMEAHGVTLDTDFFDNAEVVKKAFGISTDVTIVQKNHEFVQSIVASFAKYPEKMLEADNPKAAAPETVASKDPVAKQSANRYSLHKYHAYFPGILLRYGLSAKKHSAPKVLDALNDMSNKIGSEYTTEECIEVAKNYLAFLQAKHSHKRSGDIKKYILELESRPLLQMAERQS